GRRRAIGPLHALLQSVGIGPTACHHDHSLFFGPLVLFCSPQLFFRRAILSGANLAMDPRRRTIGPATCLHSQGCLCILVFSLICTCHFSLLSRRALSLLFLLAVLSFLPRLPAMRFSSNLLAVQPEGSPLAS